MMETIHNEWHREPENKRVLEDLVRVAFPTVKQLHVAHHICMILDDGTEREIASAETFMFNHEVLQNLFGERWEGIAADLVQVSELDRLKYLDSIRSLWEKN